MLQMSLLASVVWDEFYGCYGEETCSEAALAAAESFGALEELASLWYAERDSATVEDATPRALFSDGNLTMESALEQMALLAGKMAGLTDANLGDCAERRALPPFQCRCTDGAEHSGTHCVSLLHLIVKCVEVSNSDTDTCSAFEFALDKARPLPDVGNDLWIAYLTFRFGDNDDVMSTDEWSDLQQLVMRGITWITDVAGAQPLPSVLDQDEAAALSLINIGSPDHCRHTPVVTLLTPCRSFLQMGLEYWYE